ncbi:PAS domain S-box protein [Dyella solisilvae]|uniref:histidine kinase n=1 Tax=Dyella solisilvae TaxID=1920168 RepID=A0A370K2B0_9GAMM|nr:PAS domain-containing sensor histidine kinase [Dyella solisilvae]RDI96801.1 PAS domain S-box protein [Dyella solisilvae]
MLNPRRVLDALSALVWTMFPDGRMKFVNRWLAEYTGFHTENGSQRLWRVVINPRDIRPSLERWQSIRRSGQPGRIEVRIRRHDGQFRWFATQISPVLDDVGQIIEWCGVGQEIEVVHHGDIGERLTRPEFESIVDNIAVPAAVIAPNGELEHLNKLSLEFFGKSLQEIKGWRASDVVHPDDLAQTVIYQANAHREGLEYNIESRHRRADGVYRWHNVRGFPLRDSQGQILRWIHLRMDIDDRKRAEIALAESERKLQSIVSTIPTLAWSTRLDGSADFINQHYLDYVGLSHGQAHDWAWQTAVHPDDLEGLTIRWMTILESGQPGDAEARLRRHDGIYRWFLFRVNPLRDETGRIVKWYGTNTDIDDLKRTERELRRHKALLGQAQRLSQTGSLWWKPSTGEIAFSDQGYRILEYPRTSEPSLAMFTERCHPEDIGLVWNAAHRLVREGVNLDLECRLLMPAGIVKHIHLVAERIEITAGEPKFIAALTDVSESKHSAEALERSESFLAEGQHLAKMGNFSWHPLTGDIQWSRPLYCIFEVSTDTELTLEVIKSRLHPDDAHLHDEIVRRMSHGERHLEYKHRILRPDKSVKYVHMVAHRSGCEAGELRYIGAIRDVTQEHLAEEALSRARAQLTRVARVSSLGVLTASIAHEVNQPLAGIVTNAGACLRMLAFEPPDLEGARETARRTIRDGNRAAEVIVRLRALFSNRLSTIELIDLNEVAREVIALLRGELSGARVILRVEFADSLPLVSGDRVQLQQVILNLLRNAAEAMSEIASRPRLLKVRTTCGKDGRICFEARDTGIGLPTEAVERVFDAFYTTKPEGMGMGLSVSRSIIESHHGQLMAAPNDDGQGAVFMFSLPALQQTS